MAATAISAKIIAPSVAEVVDDLSEHEDDRDVAAGAEVPNLLPGEDKTIGASRDLPQQWRGEKSVLCMPGSKMWLSFVSAK